MPIKVLILLVVFLSGLFVMSVVNAELASQIQNSSQTLVLDVQNMTCPMCKFTIKKALSAVAAGTENVSINYTDKTATVSFDPQPTNSDALTTAITNADYPATVKTTPK
ncbi:MAG: periplasmic mercuric ion binding protein [Methyloprofundus sp.]|nr:MAG: periplasmic mercuric ion binding protein [Methyloprofundus sp.]